METIQSQGAVKTQSCLLVLFNIYFIAEEGGDYRFL